MEENEFMVPARVLPEMLSISKLCQDERDEYCAKRAELWLSSQKKKNQKFASSIPYAHRAYNWITMLLTSSVGQKLMRASKVDRLGMLVIFEYDFGPSQGNYSYRALGAVSSSTGQAGVGYYYPGKHARIQKLFDPISVDSTVQIELLKSFVGEIDRGVIWERIVARLRQELKAFKEIKY